MAGPIAWIRKYLRVGGKERVAPPKVNWRAVTEYALALAASVSAGLVLDPRTDWARYFFSSLFQGFAAILGIAVTGALISLQLSTDQYGSRVASRSLTESVPLRYALITFVVVLLSAAGGMVVGSLPQASDQTLLPGYYITKALAGVATLAALIAGHLTWVLLKGLASSLTPGGVLRSLADRLVSCGSADLHGQEEITGEVLDVLERLSERGPAFFEDGVRGYVHRFLRVFVTKERRDHWRLSQRLIGPLERFAQYGKPVVSLAFELVRVANLAVDMRSPGAFPLATVLGALDPASAVVAYKYHMGWTLQKLELFRSWEPWGVVIAARLLFWWQADLYPLVLQSLTGPFSPKIEELAKSLPPDTTDQNQFVKGLAKALPITAGALDKVAKELHDMHQYEVEGAL